jgi:hypothetical protein
MSQRELRLLYGIWAVVISAACWCWAFVPELRQSSQLVIILAPLFLWRRKTFQQPVSRGGVLLILVALVLLILSVLVGWLAAADGWLLSTPIRIAAAIVVWVCLILGGHNAISKRMSA